MHPTNAVELARRRVGDHKKSRRTRTGRKNSTRSNEEHPHPYHVQSSIIVPAKGYDSLRNRLAGDSTTSQTAQAMVELDSDEFPPLCTATGTDIPAEQQAFETVSKTKGNGTKKQQQRKRGDSQKKTRRIKKDDRLPHHVQSSIIVPAQAQAKPTKVNRVVSTSEFKGYDNLRIRLAGDSKTEKTMVELVSDEFPPLWSATVEEVESTYEEATIEETVAEETAIEETVVEETAIEETVFKETAIEKQAFETVAKTEKKRHRKRNRCRHSMTSQVKGGHSVGADAPNDSIASAIDTAVPAISPVALIEMQVSIGSATVDIIAKEKEEEEEEEEKVEGKAFEPATMTSNDVTNDADFMNMPPWTPVWVSYMDSHMIGYSHPLWYPSLYLADIKTQVEFYFSEKNLVNDGYLRSLMDCNGWVAMDEVICTFNRMLQLWSRLDQPFWCFQAAVFQSLTMSQVVNVCQTGDGRCFLRSTGQNM